MVITPQMFIDEKKTYVSQELIDNPKKLYYFLNKTSSFVNKSEISDFYLFGEYKDSKYFLKEVIPIGKTKLEELVMFFNSYEKRNGLMKEISLILVTDFHSYRGASDENELFDKVELTTEARKTILSLWNKSINDFYLDLNNAIVYDLKLN